MNKAPYLVPLLMLFLLSLQSCAKHSGGEEDEEHHVTPLVTVHVAPVAIGDAVETIVATGHTDVLRREKLFSPVAGMITTLDVFDGTPVHAGQPLATILTKESYAAISGAEALLRTARSDREKNEAEQALELARSTQHSVTLSAPFDGVISARNINRGESIPENVEMMTVLDLSSIVFLAEVPLRDIGRIHPGMAATIRLAAKPDLQLNASVDAILPQSEPQSETVRIRLILHGNSYHNELRPDAAGSAGLILGTRKKAMLVPKQAVLRDDEKNTFSVVYVTPDSIALTVPVEVGVQTDSTSEVISPILREGMPVITEGHYKLADSTKVTIATKDSR